MLSGKPGRVWEGWLDGLSYEMMARVKEGIWESLCRGLVRITCKCVTSCLGHVYDELENSKTFGIYLPTLMYI